MRTKRLFTTAAILVFAAILANIVYWDIGIGQYQPSMIYRRYIRTVAYVDSTAWTQVSSNGLGNTNNKALRSAAVFQDLLFIGTDNGKPNKNKLYTVDQNETIASRTLTNGIGVNDTFNISTSKITVFDGKLVLAHTDTLGRGRLYSITSMDTSLVVVDTNGRGDNDNDSVTVMQEFKGRLYVAYKNDNRTLASKVLGGAELWSTADLSTWAVSDTNGFDASGICENTQITSATVWNGYIWVGTYNRTGCQMFRSTDGVVWTVALSDSGFNRNAPRSKMTSIDQLIPMGQYLYAITGDTAGVRIYRTDARRDTAWYAITFKNDSGFGEVGMKNVRATSALVYGNKLFVGTKSSRGARVFYTTADTNIFIGASTRGFGDTTNTEICFLVSYQGYIWAGTNNPTGGGELWKLHIGLYESDGVIKANEFQSGASKITNENILTDIVKAWRGYIINLYTRNVEVSGSVRNSKGNTFFAGKLGFPAARCSVAIYIAGATYRDIVIPGFQVHKDSVWASTYRDSAWVAARPETDSIRFWIGGRRSFTASGSDTVVYIRVAVP